MARKLNPDMRPACQDHEFLHADAWFPEPPEGHVKGYEAERDSMLRLSVEALKACSTCPIRQACLDFSFQVSDTIDYGIYGGTLSHERRAASGGGVPAGRGPRNFEHAIRALARREGVPTPTIPKRKRAQAWIRDYPDMLGEAQSRANLLGLQGQKRLRSQPLSSSPDSE